MKVIGVVLWAMAANVMCCSVASKVRYCGLMYKGDGTEANIAVMEARPGKSKIKADWTRQDHGT